MNKLLIMLICSASSSYICSVRSLLVSPNLDSYTEIEIETWGELKNVRAIDQKTAIAPRFVLEVQNRTLAFPSVFMKDKCAS